MRGPYRISTQTHDRLKRQTERHTGEPGSGLTPHLRRPFWMLPHDAASLARNTGVEPVFPMHGDMSVRMVSHQLGDVLTTHVAICEGLMREPQANRVEHQ